MVFRLEAFFAKGFVRLEAIFHHGIFIASTDAWRGSGSATQWAEVAGLLAIASALVALVLRRRRKNWRHCAAASLALATVCAGAAGARAWLRAAVGPERLAVLDAMARRPSDPWPRGADHVPLGAVGATEMDKGYLETGGSFSPWFGSFGLSFWIVGDDGQLIATSDGTGGAQSYRAGPKGEPGVVSVTDAYEAKVTVLADGRRTLDIESRLPRGRHLEVALRGVGPAGGALNEILVDGKILTLNRRFSVGLDQAPELAFVGEEGTKDWLSPMKDAPSRTLSATGWAHARFRLPASGRLSLTIADPQRRPPATALPLGPSPKLTGTDPRFAESLRAQIETLNQSLVGMQTRPGDPAAYPLEWQRDGAFVLVALARSGERDLARSLAPPFAQRDFFGGYGAEADAPGLALWALGEVSAAIGDPAFEHDIWPDIERKAGLILDMLQANDDVRRDFQGPLLPRLAAGDYDGKRVALPARDGLISGTMDFTQPVFYVNAVSHSGLAAAARMARRTGHDKQAEAWEREARALQAAWRRAFAQDTAGPGQVEDDHTFIFSLWPAELAPPKAYQRLLERRWADRRDAAGGFRAKPAGTYFDLAEAHQWLRLGQPDRVWSTLEWFWDHQSAPGLYTLWEGAGEENTFDMWRGVRGWVAPDHVTPHYWSAAEMLLLQLAMLAEVHGEQGAQTLVVGAGAPGEWLGRKLDFSGVWTSAGMVGWSWDGAEVTVTLTEAAGSLPIRLGPAFPPGTPVRRLVVPARG